MIVVTCIYTWKYKKERIYKIQSENGEIINVKESALKRAILHNEVYVTNMVIGNKGRLKVIKGMVEMDIEGSYITIYKDDINQLDSKVNLVFRQVKSIEDYMVGKKSGVIRAGLAYVYDKKSNVLEVISNKKMKFYCRHYHYYSTYEIYHDRKLVTFYRTKFISVDLRDVDLSNMNTMFNFFAYCKSLREVNMHGVDLSRVDSMNNMFTFCSQLRNVDLGDTKYEKLRMVKGIFSNCIRLENVDIDQFRVDLKNDYALYRCGKLKNKDEIKQKLRLLS